MFEYLMPLLVMRSLPATLLDQTHRAAVRLQVAHGREHNLPWGMSESAYNLRDRQGTYQYRAFGVPSLALKRGLGQDQVVAPSATMLALLVDPDAGRENCGLLEREAPGDSATRSITRGSRPTRSRPSSAPTWRITWG